MTECGQPLSSRGSRTEWRGPTDESLLEGAFAAVDQRVKQAGSVAEAAEEGPLADTGLVSDCLHRDALGTTLVQQPSRRVEKCLAVTGGISSLAPRSPGQG
jgi:hypothetical protein